MHNSTLTAYAILQKFRYTASVSQESLCDKFPETVDILPWHVVRGCRLCRSVIFTGDIRKTNAALKLSC